ncbi:hypothetical protein KGY79_12630, partial [Candidatus Bipolaricaulota bacterium]|nr:hypothetical protein [Candidatus Bipolaricaulota bacterium]
MEKNLTKFRLKTFLVVFSSLLVIAISISIPTYADQVQTPSCTCGEASSCEYNSTPTETTTTIWVKKSGASYEIRGGPKNGEVYYPGTTILEGTSGPDLIIGSQKGDIIKGGNGDDTICGEPDEAGGSGVDEIYGGPGADYICGG